MKARLTGRTPLALLAALIMFVSAGPALARAAEPALQQADPEPFSWWLEPRFELGWYLYDPDTHSYPAEYLYPGGWQVGFDACESPLAGGREVTSYRWHVEGVGHVYSFDSEPGASCRLDSTSSPAAPKLPVEGRYVVTLALAFGDGSETTGSLQIVVEDQLIVSIGDSNASGEGNPHVNQVGGLRPVNDVWFDRRCHRSAMSGHAMAAASIEANDPHTAVTYLSFACSGAEIWSGLVSSYYGIEQPDNSLVTPLKPQLLALMEHLCQADDATGCIENPRQIDSLFLSIGVNDLGFSTIIKNCAGRQTLDEVLTEDLFIAGVLDSVLSGDWESLASYHLRELQAHYDLLVTALAWLADLLGLAEFACEDDLDPLIDMNLATLWMHYGLLGRMLDGEAGEIANELRENPNSHYWMSPSVRERFRSYYGDLPTAMTASIKPGAVYVTSYPEDPFTDADGNHGGCGVFRLLSADEARWIGKQGPRLNQRVRWAATANRWHYVDGIAEGFEGHGYCAGSASYFVSLSDSFMSQFNIDGTLHPNRDGHDVTRDRLLDAYYAQKPDWSAKHGVTVRIEAVRIQDGRDQPQSQATFTAKVNDEWYRHEIMIDQLEVPVGDWYSLPEERFTYRAKLADDDVITVLAHTALGGGLHYPPKCNSFDCAQPIEATRLATARDYGLANNWGASVEWCQEEPDVRFYQRERVCALRVTDDVFALDVRYRITVVDLVHSPHVPIDEDPITCGPNCHPAAPPPATPLAEYRRLVEAAGESTAVLAELIAALSQVVATS